MSFPPPPDRTELASFPPTFSPFPSVTSLVILWLVAACIPLQQWGRLHSNGESLLPRLPKSGLWTRDTRDRIESWHGQKGGKDWIADWTVPRICRPYNANEVFVTGTFDDWGKTVRLDRVDDGFAKTVSLPIEKVQYKAGLPFLSSDYPPPTILPLGTCFAPR